LQRGWGRGKRLAKCRMKKRRGGMLAGAQRKPSGVSGNDATVDGKKREERRTKKRRWGGPRGELRYRGNPCPRHAGRTGGRRTLRYLRGKKRGLPMSGGSEKTNRGSGPILNRARMGKEKRRGKEGRPSERKKGKSLGDESSPS